MRLIRFVLLPLLLSGALSGCGNETPGGDGVPAMPSTAVTVRTMEFGNGADRPLPTLIYHPPTPGRHPLVVFSHGYTRRPEDYDMLLRAWARAGFVVAAPVFPHSARGSATMDIEDLARQPADVTAVITAVLALDTRQGDPLSGALDATKVAAGGHSLGAMTTMGLVTSYARDKRVGAAIVLAGNSHVMGTDFPDTGPSLFFAHGTLDQVVHPEDGRRLYEAYPGRKAFLTIKDGDHLGPYLGDDPGQTQALAAATTDYLLWSLRGDAEALKRLNSLMDFDSKLS